MVSPFVQESNGMPPPDLEDVLVERTKRRFTRWAWRLFYGFLICIVLSTLINVSFIAWRESLDEKVITIHNIRDLNSIELCPGDSVRYQYSVASDMISPTVGVLIFSLADTCPPEGE